MTLKKTVFFSFFLCPLILFCSLLSFTVQTECATFSNTLAERIQILENDYNVAPTNHEIAEQGKMTVALSAIETTKTSVDDENNEIVNSWNKTVAAKLAAEASARLYTDDNNYPGFYGRLHIPAVGIDVALYSSSSQYVCNRADSCCYFYFNGSTVMGDHSNQAFRTLTSVSTGMTAYIDLAGGGRLNLLCTGVLNGHNHRDYFSDSNYNCLNGAGPYITYTCTSRDGFHIRICLWTPY